MLSGSLDDFTLPEVLRMLSTLKKSGTLQVTRKAGDGRIDFIGGTVVYAETELAKSHLGQKLVSSGRITDVQLRQALDVQATTGDRLGRILRVSDAISEDDLRAAVKGQIEDSAFELMCWEAGEFEWQKGEPEASDVDVSLDVDDLISAVQGRVARRDEIRKNIDSPNAVPRMAASPPPGAAAISITGPQWRVLALVDGTRSIETIAKRASVERDEAGRMILELATGGLIEVAEGRSKQRALAPKPEEVMQPDVSPQASAEDSAPPSALRIPVAPAPRENGSPPDEWFEDPATPSNGSQADGVAFPDAATSPAPPSADGPTSPAPPSADGPTSPAPPSAEIEVPAVDRSAVVKELAGLFQDPDVVARVPEGPKDEADVADRPAPPPPPRGRLTRWGRRTTKD